MGEFTKETATLGREPPERISDAVSAIADEVEVGRCLLEQYDEQQNGFKLELYYISTDGNVSELSDHEAINDARHGAMDNKEKDKTARSKQDAGEQDNDDDDDIQLPKPKQPCKKSWR